MNDWSGCDLRVVSERQRGKTNERDRRGPAFDLGLRGVQETLAKVFVKWHGIDTPYAYAQRTLMRTYLSGRRRRSSTEQPWAEVPDDVKTWDPTALSDLRLSLQDALSELTPLDRAVLVLRHLEDLSVAQTAERLGLSQGAVKNRNLRALNRVRDRSLR